MLKGIKELENDNKIKGIKEYSIRSFAFYYNH